MRILPPAGFLDRQSANFNRHSVKTVVVVNTLVGTAVSHADKEVRKNQYLCDKEFILCLSVLLKASSAYVNRYASIPSAQQAFKTFYS